NWNDEPCKQIRDDARTDSGRERDEQVEHAHERYVEIEILSQPGTNASDLSLCAGAYQSLRGRSPHHITAVRARPTVISDGLAASVAVHDCASSRFDTTIAGKM